MRRGILIKPNYHSLKSAESISRVLHEKPAHWEKHLGERDGLFTIIEEEYHNMRVAKKTGTHGEVVEALRMLSAASKFALDSMTC